MPPVITINNLSARYGRFAALKNLNVTVEEGVVGLLGPNGAGKTTLIRTLLGLLPPAAGDVEVMGIDVQQRPLEVRRLIGYVPEGQAHLPGISAVKFVAFAAELAGIDQRPALKRAHEVLEYVGLKEGRYRKVEDLSHGQRARVKLAQALCHNVELLLLDEPTDGLDPAGRENFLQLVTRIHRSAGINILFATHTLEDVETLCSRAVFLHDGEVLAVKDMARLREGYRQSYVVHLSRPASDFLRVCAARGVKATGHERDKALVEDIDDPRVMFRIALEAKTGTLGVFPWRPTLESMFVEMVKHKRNGSPATR